MTPREPELVAGSLFGEILDWMLAPLLLLWPVSIAVTYLMARSIAGVPFDHALEGRASVLARQVVMVQGAPAVPLPPATRDWLLDDPDDSTLYQIRAPGGRVMQGNASLPAPVLSDAPQPGIVRFRDDTFDGQELRIAYVYALAPGSDDTLVLIQVAETLRKRAALANDVIKGVILPQFVILPLVIMLVWFGLSRGLAPLHALQARIRERRPNDTSPLPAAEAPIEIAPLVASFNDLLLRLDENTVIQKRFIAQAAHQMKTPLAGLRMQAELALRHPDPTDVQRSLEQIARSSRQAARLVTQLLALARAENAEPGQRGETIDIARLARDVVHDWVAPALEKRMDLGFEAPPEVSGEILPDTGTACTISNGQPVMLREMLSNLIDNAIRYTPAGGRITVRIRAGSAQAGQNTQAAATVIIEVEDTGPGIPEAERERVLERFYRILGRDGDGSGLGLAIVNEIVTQHGGTLRITDHFYVDTAAHPQAGTLIRVSLPVSHLLAPYASVQA